MSNLDKRIRTGKTGKKWKINLESPLERVQEDEKLEERVKRLKSKM